MGYIIQKNSFICYGRVTTDPRHRTFDSGKEVTNFGVAYENTLGDDGERKKSIIYVDAWGKILAPYAACLEKGDIVLVAGLRKLDEYMTAKKGEDTYKLTADFVMCQPTAGYEEGEYDEEAAETLRRDAKERAGGKSNYQSNYHSSYEDPGLVELPDGAGGELPF